MEKASAWLLLLSCLCVNLHPSNAVGMESLPFQVVPQEILQVNGSDISIGCEIAIKQITISDNIISFCGTFGVEGSLSYLVDGNTPAIDTSTTDWASELVTARKTQRGDIPYDHVLMTFDFVDAVTLTSIELDLFLCPEWNIGAPSISVYTDATSTLDFVDSTLMLEYDIPQLMTSCSSLSTICIPLEEAIGENLYHTWHLLVTFEMQPNTDWVHIGEVRFLDIFGECTTSIGQVMMTTSRAPLNIVSSSCSMDICTSTVVQVPFKTVSSSCSMDICTSTVVQVPFKTVSSSCSMDICTSTVVQVPFKTVSSSCSMDICTSTVVQDIPITTTTMSPDDNSSSIWPTLKPVLIVIGALVLIIIVIIVLVGVVALITKRQKKKPSITNENVYDYIQPPTLPRRNIMEDNDAYRNTTQTETIDLEYNDAYRKTTQAETIDLEYNDAYRKTTQAETIDLKDNDAYRMTTPIDLEYNDAYGANDLNMDENAAYGKILQPQNHNFEDSIQQRDLENSGSNSLGLFLTPAQQRNIAYGAIPTHNQSNADSESYELTNNSFPTQSYEIPNSPCLNTVL